MHQRPDANIYSFSDITFLDNLNKDDCVSIKTISPCWEIDYALENDIDIDGIKLPAGFCRLSYNNGVARTIRPFGENKACFLTIHIHENTYAVSEFISFRKVVPINTYMIHPLLKVISNIQHTDQIGYNNISLKCYIQILIARFTTANAEKLTVKISTLKQVFNTIEDIGKQTNHFPLPSDLATKAGASKINFQKACLTLYNQTAQKIIHHFKMKLAFDYLLIQHMDIQSTSEQLGYNFSPNFITAFHHYYLVTPMEAIQRRSK